MQVLIAEDENITRRLLRATLEKNGYQVEETRNGKEALDRLCGEAPPALALLDWNMPELTGLEVCRKVRDRSPGSRYTYMVLLTARHSSEDAVLGLQAGADDFV